VNGLALLAVLQTSLLLGAGPTDGAVPYAVARQKMEQTGTPMLVMVSAEWCAACRQMKTTVIPQVQRRGLLGRVMFTVVDLDREPELGRALTDGGPIPQLVLYRKSPRGWFRRRLVGGQSPATVEKMIRDALAAQTSENGEQNTAGGDSPDSETPSDSRTKAQRVSAGAEEQNRP